MEDMAFIKAITRFLKEDQYLKEEAKKCIPWKIGPTQKTTVVVLDDK